MGSIVSKPLDLIFEKRESRIIMVGLDSGGKTTILHKLKLGEIVTNIPTIGINIKTAKFKNISWTMFDVCYPKDTYEWKILMIKKFGFFREAHGLVFVVDSQDHDRMDEAKHLLHKLLDEEELRHSVVLVFANKQDLHNAMSTSQITDRLDLHSLRQPNWFVQASSATCGTGFDEGLEWLYYSLTKVNQ